MASNNARRLTGDAGRGVEMGGRHLTQHETENDCPMRLSAVDDPSSLMDVGWIVGMEGTLVSIHQWMDGCPGAGPLCPGAPAFLPAPGEPRTCHGSVRDDQLGERLVSTCSMHDMDARRRREKQRTSSRPWMTGGHGDDEASQRVRPDSSPSHQPR